MHIHICREVCSPEDLVEGECGVARSHGGCEQVTYGHLHDNALRAGDVAQGIDADDILMRADAEMLWEGGGRGHETIATSVV